MLFAGVEQGTPVTCPGGAASNCGLWRSQNGGSTWTVANLASQDVGSEAFNSVQGLVFVGANITGLGNSVAKSTDDGITWTPVDDGFEHKPVMRTDPFSGSSVYAFDTFEMSESTDAGATWSKVTLPVDCGVGNDAFCSTQVHLSDLAVISSATTVSQPPSIAAAISASAFGAFTSVAPGTFTEIYGSNLASDTRGWTAADFNGNNAPTSLDGTSVSIAGQPAFVNYISPGQVNILIPSTVPTGTQPLTVTTALGTTNSTVTVNAVEPGLLATPTFDINGVPYVVALFSDGTYVLPTGAVAGITSRPANPGETIVLYGIGFGPVTPSIPAGQLVSEANMLATNFQISVGGVPATVAYAGLAPNFTGLYQFNVVVPNTAAGNQSLTFTLGGSAGTQTLNLAIGN